MKCDDFDDRKIAELQSFYVKISMPHSLRFGFSFSMFFFVAVFRVGL